MVHRTLTLVALAALLVGSVHGYSHLGNGGLRRTGNPAPAVSASSPQSGEGSSTNDDDDSSSQTASAQPQPQSQSQEGSSASSGGGSNTAGPVSQKGTFFFDLDGTTYKDHKLLPGVKEMVDWLKAHNKKFVFVTNSASQSPDTLIAKLAKYGIPGLTHDNVYGAAQATSAYLKRKKPGARVHLLGGQGITDILTQDGFELTQENPDFVVVGSSMPLGDWSYAAFANATKNVSKGAKLIGSAPDSFMPTGDGPVPGVGSFIKVIETAAETKATFMGKPAPAMILKAIEMSGSRPEDCVMVGDRLDTDIEGGDAANIDTMLVLTGSHKCDDIGRFPSTPTYVLNSIADIPKETKRNVCSK